MKIYEKYFVNPLLALAFKAGVEFANDDNLEVSEPQKVYENKWMVEIQDHFSDEDEDIAPNDDELVVEFVPEQTEEIIQNIEVEKKLTFDEYVKSHDLTPICAKVMELKEFSEPVVESLSGVNIEDSHPCGRCFGCLSNRFCYEEIKSETLGTNEA